MRFSKKHGMAVGAVVLAVFVAAPAIGAAAGSGHSDKQPPAGARTNVTQVQHVAKQPAQGTVTHTTHAAKVPKQPVNRHPVKSTGFQAGKQLRHSRHDKGVKGLRPTKDHGTKNLPAQKG